MAKPKAESWLTTAFYEGVAAYALADRPRPAPAYRGALGRCWLAQHDERRRPCSGPFERFHFLNRQRVENALAALLPYNPVNVFDPDSIFELDATRRELILLAAWDPRNGEISCQAHHRRFDSHATPTLAVPSLRLPTRTIDFILDWGLESQMRDRFPN